MQDRATIWSEAERLDRWKHIMRLEGALRTAVGFLEIREKTTVTERCLGEWRDMLDALPPAK
jgi:hypothetical protein